jgi:Predicted pyridoxal phosphate-dependent enzyme apparently involved in regulation of cell wall biogenesis
VLEQQAASIINTATKTTSPVVFTNSGTSALMCALYSCDAPLGSLVIGPNYGYHAWFNVARFMKLNIAVADVNPNTLCMSYDSVKELVDNYAVSAIIYVYHLGILDRDILRIRELCDARNIVLIEDSCNSLGSTMPDFNTFGIGDISCLSFSEKKTIDLGEGGCGIINNPALLERFMECQFQGNFHRGNKSFALGLNLQMNTLALERLITYDYSSIIAERQRVYESLPFNVIHAEDQTSPSRLCIACNASATIAKFNKFVKRKVDLTSDDNYKTITSFDFEGDFFFKSCIVYHAKYTPDILYLPNYNELDENTIKFIQHSLCFS